MSKKKQRGLSKKAIKDKILEDYKKHCEKYYNSNNIISANTSVKRKRKEKGESRLQYMSNKNKDIKQSKGEFLIEASLKKYKIEFRKEVEFPGLINPITKKKLRFDFYLPKLRICIEFDGEQHFKTVEDFDDKDETKLLKRQKLDKIKNNFCKTKKIKLIRIKYYEINSIDKIINSIPKMFINKIK